MNVRRCQGYLSCCTSVSFGDISVPSFYCASCQSVSLQLKAAVEVSLPPIATLKRQDEWLEFNKNSPIVDLGII